MAPETCFQKGGQKYTGEREGPQSYLRGASMCWASKNSCNPKGHLTLIGGARLGVRLCPSSASNTGQVVTSSSFAQTGDEHLHLHQSCEENTSWYSPRPPTPGGGKRIHPKRNVRKIIYNNLETDRGQGQSILLEAYSPVPKGKRMGLNEASRGRQYWGAGGGGEQSCRKCTSPRIRQMLPAPLHGPTPRTGFREQANETR